MSKKLSFSIAVNLLTENFKKGTNTVKNSLRSMQMQVLTFAAALGAGGLGISGLITRFKDVARETSRVITALKNVSDGTKGFADNLRFVNNLANKYGLEVNALTGNFAKFTASATQANMPMDEQTKIFESLSRASTAFALSAEQTDGVFLALSQMMGKGKISMEELRKQMGEKLPIAMQAMANALGVSVAEMDKLVSTGKVMAADVLPKFAEALNEMIPNVDTDNLESSLNRLSNVFGKIVNASGAGDKYKALIDGLTSLLKSASENIKNIILGIIAVIAFAVANSLNKTYQGYVNSGKRIVENEEITSRKMRSSVQAYTESKKRLSDLELQHAQANGQKQIALATRIESTKTQLAGRTTVARKAIADRVLAHESAAQVKSAGRLGTLGAMVAGTAKKIGSAVKSMFASFGFAAVIAGITALIGYFVNLYQEAKRIKNIFSEYRKEADNVGNTQEIKILQAQLAIMNDKTKSEKEIIAAQSELRRLLGLEKTDQSDLNKLVADRVQLLKETARADLYARKAAETEYAIKSRATDLGLSDTQLKELAELKNNNDPNFSKAHGEFARKSKSEGKVPKFTGGDYWSNFNDGIKETIEDLKVIADAEEGLTDASNKSNILTTPEKTDLTEAEKDKALRAAEKRLEALRKLGEEDRKRQIEKQKFDIEMKQKSIDLMDDSFEKRTKQTTLNLAKEKLAIEEHQSKLLKDQQEHLKTEYASVKGNDPKKFESYFADQKKKDFKDEKGISILPEGLRPEDIDKQVGQLLDAAQNAQQKGLTDINKDLSAMLLEQQNMFKSDKDKKLAELDTYYNAELIKAVNNAELIKQIEANRKRETQAVTTDDNIKRLDFEQQLKLEQTAGMESIGMTELVEEKKLEITKKYLQLRIEALKELADAGDEDSKQQIKHMQASLDKLNMQKPSKSLKALADKAIFDTIKNGFKKAGDSAEDFAQAEEKTIKLMGSISAKAGIVANITNELKSMFGGMNEDLDMALDTVGNIAQGFATGGIVGGAMAVIGEGMKLFSKASEAAARHQKALKEIAEARLASQRAYNLLLLEQNLLMKEAVSIFGEKQITRAANAMKNYRDATTQLESAKKGDAPTPIKNLPGIFGKIDKARYDKELSDYNKGIGGLAKAQIVTGHKKTGAFGWGKGKDTYSSILNVAEYKDLIKANGELDREMLQTIINTRKMSVETKLYLQNILDLYDQAEAAQEELRNYLQSTFGVLGNDIMTSIENAIRDKGISAWEDFGDAGAKVIEQLGKQIAYELFFAEKFKKLQSDLEAVYGSGKTEEEIANDAMALVGGFYQGIGQDMERAQGFMEEWQKKAKEKGLEIYKPDQSNTQDSTKGYSVSMDQDTGGAILGGITGIHESILILTSMVSGISMDTSKSLTHTISIGDELKKHTEIFHEMRDIQTKTLTISKEMKESLGALGDMKSDLASINKNTKGLAPR